MNFRPLTRHATARVIAAIAECELPMGLWANLIPILSQAATSSIVSQRETASFILATIIGTIGSEDEQLLSDAFKLFAALLHDPESLEVRVTSVK